MVKLARQIADELDDLEKRLRNDDEIHHREGRYFLDRHELNPDSGYLLSRFFPVYRQYVTDVSRYGGDSSFLEELCASDAYLDRDVERDDGNPSGGPISAYTRLQKAMSIDYDEFDRDYYLRHFREDDIFPPYVAVTFSVIVDIEREIWGAYVKYRDSCAPNWLAFRDAREKAEAEAIGVAEKTAREVSRNTILTNGPIAIEQLKELQREITIAAEANLNSRIDWWYEHLLRGVGNFLNSLEPIVELAQNPEICTTDIYYEYDNRLLGDYVINLCNGATEIGAVGLENWCRNRDAFTEVYESVIDAKKTCSRKGRS